MDAPAIPPYAHVTSEWVQCAKAASVRYAVPETLLHAILAKEGGRIGTVSRNANGTVDLGPAQINSAWLSAFARYGVSAAHLSSDVCTNLAASAYILKKNWYAKDQNWFYAIVSYNIGPNRWVPDRYAIGYRYAKDVVAYWWHFENVARQINQGAR